MDKTVAQRLEEYRNTAKTNAQPTVSVADRLAEHRFNTTFNLETVDNDINSLINTTKQIVNGGKWYSNNELDVYKSNIGKMTNNLEYYKKRNSANTSLVKNIDANISVLNNLNKALDQQREIFANFKNQDEYLKQKGVESIIFTPF